MTYFSTYIRDKIEKKHIGLIETYENIGKSAIDGIENTVSLDFAKLLGVEDRTVKLYSDATYLFRACDITNDKDIYRVSKLKFNCGIEYTDKKLGSRIHLRHVGKMKDDNWFRTVYSGKPVIEYGNFTVIDLNLSYTVTKNIVASIKINNIFDQAYEEKPGYPMPGRNISIGLNLKF